MPNWTIVIDPVTVTMFVLAVGVYSWVRAAAAWQKHKERKRRITEREESIAKARAYEARKRG